MALSSRNSTAIVVDGTSFRWTVSARSQHRTDRVTLVVRPDDNGSRLAVEIPCRDPYLNFANTANEFDVLSITPELVHRIIVNAITIGWKPFIHNGQFDVRFIAATMRDVGGEEGATCHVCWKCPLCDQWYSDDVEHGTTAPIMTTCGRTKKHDSGTEGRFILFW